MSASFSLPVARISNATRVALNLSMTCDLRFVCIHVNAACFLGSFSCGSVTFIHVVSSVYRHVTFSLGSFIVVVHSVLSFFVRVAFVMFLYYAMCITIDIEFVNQFQLMRKLNVELTIIYSRKL